jgi:EmrB/QacA subfamily drug resistance transporter
MGTVAINMQQYRLRWWTLVFIATSVVLIVTDASSVNIALPTLQRELGASVSDLQWIISSYIMVFGALMLISGALGDRFGRARILRIGIVIFSGASLAAAFAGNGSQLILWRSIQGVGAAMILPATLAIITNVFPREERGKAIGVWAGINGFGIALGPIIAGLLIERFGWPWVFLYNLPIAAVALLGGWFLIPESRDVNPKPLDLPGTIISIAGLSTLTFGLIRGGDLGWTDPAVIGTLAASVVLIIGLVIWERYTTHPMLNLNFFRSRRFSVGVGAVSITGLSMVGITFAITLYLQFVQGYTPLETGIRFIPLALGLFIGGGSSDKLVARLGTNRVMAFGFMITIVLGILVSFWQADTAYWQLGLFFFGIGFALGYIAAPATDAVMGALPEAQAGVGSAVNTVMRMVAGAVGVAALGSVLNTIYTQSFERAATVISGLPTEVTEVASSSIGAAMTVAEQLPPSISEPLVQIAGDSFMNGWQVMAIIVSVVGVVGVILTLKFMPPRHEVL